MKNLLVSILVLILAVGLYLTNPTKEDFVDHLTNEIENDESPGLEKLLESLLSRPIAKLLAETTEVKDYQLFSVYYMELGGNEKTYLGIFNDFYRLNGEEQW